MNLDTIIRTMALLGADTAAYRALLQQIMVAFAPVDQATLQATYDEAMAGAERAHRAAQAD